MPTGSRAGKDWSKGELDLVVGDYFRMLQAEQTGQAYNKALHRSSLTPFYLTRIENDVARDNILSSVRLYRLYDFSRRPGLFTLTPPLEPVLRLEAMTFRASLR